ncbi:sensor domain-containing diguanylate cyclase [Methylosinus sp. LW4]|uniref:sensor domain-containing diguanylate cyclase n=1 Tax=Methylosinus sp. LW4 TaxID=136993 RepID=UPI000381FB91|nr:sensor domain-containing diguanylate cyclase [Methylosinus sp. LW4]
MYRYERDSRSEERDLDPEELAAAIRADQAQMLATGQSVLVFNAANAAIVASIFHDFYPRALIVAWLVAIAILVVARIIHARRFRAMHPTPEAVRRFLALWTLGSTLTGCLWGAASSVLWLTPDPGYHAFALFAAGGMAAGAIVTNSAYLPAMFGYIAPDVLPAIVGLFARAESTALAMGALLTAFTAVLVIIGLRAHGWLVSVSRRRLQQEALSAALHQRNALLHAVSTAATELTTAAPSAAAIPDLLESVGAAIDADRILVFESGAAPDEPPSLLHFWRRADSPVALDASFFEADGRRAFLSGPLLAALAERRPVTAATRTLAPGPAKSFLERAGVRSALFAPIVVDDAPWGWVEVEDCRSERIWKPAEIDALRILGDLIGGSLARQRYVDRLRDANEVVERSPTLLFRLRMDGKNPRLVYVSHNIALFGYDPWELTDPARCLADCVHPEDLDKVGASLARAAADGRRGGMVEFRFRRRDGGYRWLDARYAARDRAGRSQLIEGVALDVTERKEVADQIAILAQTDALTGLANRRSFIDALRHAFADAEAGGEPFSLLYIDVDHFKDVNDRLGHASGDALLEALATRLRSHCRAGDVVARLGGDEFAILQSSSRDAASASVMATKICALSAEPYLLPGGARRATVSVGVALFASALEGPDAMLARADRALYRAKENGRNQYRIYSETQEPANSFSI